MSGCGHTDTNTSKGREGKPPGGITGGGGPGGGKPGERGEARAREGENPRGGARAHGKKSERGVRARTGKTERVCARGARVKVKGCARAHGQKLKECARAHGLTGNGVGGGGHNILNHIGWARARPLQVKRPT